MAVTRKHLVSAGFVLLVTVGIGIVVFVVRPSWSPISFLFSSQRSTRYQMVSLFNGQVYFGTLRDVPGPYLGLHNAYSLMVSESMPSQLVRRKSQFHGPADTMWINRRNIHLVEDVGDDSRIAQALSKQEEVITFSSPQPSSLPIVAGAATQAGRKLIVNTTELGFLRVRDNPNTTSSAEIARVATGSSFPIVGEQPGWYAIEYIAGKVGWVSGQYVTVSQPSTGR